MQEDEVLQKDEDIEIDCSKKMCESKDCECIICLEKIKVGTQIFTCNHCKDSFGHHYSILFHESRPDTFLIQSLMCPQ